MFKWIKNRIKLLRNDTELAKLLFCHLLLIVLHVCEYYTTDIQYFWYLRAGGCALISILIFVTGRKGLAYGLFIYGCTLVYVNNFYNYATIFFVYIAVGANPKLKKIAPWIYIANVAIAFKLKNLDIIAFCIHCVYTVMFGIKINYVFIPNKPEVLNLTEDEKIGINNNTTKIRGVVKCTKHEALLLGYLAYFSKTSDEFGKGVYKIFSAKDARAKASNLVNRFNFGFLVRKYKEESK